VVLKITETPVAGTRLPQGRLPSDGTFFKVQLNSGHLTGFTLTDLNF